MAFEKNHREGGLDQSAMWHNTIQYSYTQYLSFDSKSTLKTESEYTSAMTAEVEIRNERVDDLPLLIAQQHKMGIAGIIDEHIEPHWHRQGLSIGRTVVAWLAFILSESDHRLSYVEPWVARHYETLKQVMAADFSVQEFNDDRLGDDCAI